MNQRFLSRLLVFFLFLLIPTIINAQDEFDIADVTCEGSYDITSTKLPLSVENLPYPEYADFVNEDRVIGATFSANALALVATTASAECIISFAASEAVVGGTIWHFADLEVTETTVVAFDLGNERAVFLDTELNFKGDAAYIAQSVEVPEGAENVPPIDVAIRADSICYTLQRNEEYTRYCLVDEFFSFREQFNNDYEIFVREPIQFAVEVLTETYDFNLNINDNLSLSEIEDSERIAGCLPNNPVSNCEADIIFAPAEANEEGVVGILVVLQPLDMNGAEVVPGMYIMLVDAGYSFEDVLASSEMGMTLLGVDEEQNPLNEVFLSAVVAPFVSPDDIGLAEITGLRIFFWCPTGQECR